MIVELNDQSFKSEVKESDKAVLVDFFAPWCGPCKSMEPILEELAKEVDGEFKIAQLNIDESPETVGEFGVMSVPTFMFFKDGEVKDQHTGMIAKENLLEKLKSL
jgi:thioredoxin 1